MKKRDLRWKTLLGLAVLWWAVFSGSVWIWGALFLLWAGLDLATGTSHFLEEIRRDRDPIFFWIVVLSWSVFGLYYLSVLFVPSGG